MSSLSKSYYFNEEGEIFYIIRVYKIFDPPKWEKGSKETSIKKSAYYVFKGKIRKSIGDTIGVAEIQNGITKVKELVELL